MNKLKSFSTTSLSMGEDLKYQILSKLASSKNGLYLSQFYDKNYDFLDFFKVLMSLYNEKLVERNKVTRKYEITSKGLEEFKKIKQA